MHGKTLALLMILSAVIGLWAAQAHAKTQHRTEARHLAEQQRLAEQWTPSRTLEGHGDAAWNVVFSADGQTLASGPVNRTIRL